MNYQHIRYETHGAVRVITFNRPEVKNCIDRLAHDELCHAFDQFRIDPDAKVAVLTGAGDSAFCAGGDLKAAFSGKQWRSVTRRPITRCCCYCCYCYCCYCCFAPCPVPWPVAGRAG